MKDSKLEKLSRDPAWKAVFTIFERFDNDGRIWRHVDLDRETIDFKEILGDGTFSGGEKRMVRIAASLFNQDFEVNLYTVLGNLDEKSGAAVVKAIQGFLDS